jgi:hypothetical protein
MPNPSSKKVRWRVRVPIVGLAEADVWARTREEAEETLRGTSPLSVLRGSLSLLRLGYNFEAATVECAGGSPDADAD